MVRVSDSVTVLLMASAMAEARSLFGGGSLSEAPTASHDRRRFSLPVQMPRPRWRDAHAATAFVHPGRQQQRQQQQQRPKRQRQQQQQEEQTRRQQQQQAGMTRYFSMVALCGAISCSVTHSLVLPLDVIKTAMQMDPSLRGPRQAAAAVLGDCRGPLCIGAFFNGLGATAIGYVLQGTFKFGGYEYIKRSTFGALSEAGGVAEELGRLLRLPIMLASAASAEVLASAVLCPCEVVKLRMQTDAAFARLGFQRAVRSLVAAEGVGALFAGFVPIALRQVPYTAVKLVSYELFANGLFRLVDSLHAWHATTTLATGHAATDAGGGGLREVPRWPVVLSAGLMAGAAAALVSQPFDLLLTRMCGSSRLVKMSECAIGEIGERTRDRLLYLLSLGWGAFSGLGPRLAMVSLMTSCQFFLYDALRTSLDCIQPPTPIAPPRLPPS